MNINEKSKWITNVAGITRRACGSELNTLDYKVPDSPIKPAGGAQTDIQAAEVATKPAHTGSVPAFSLVQN